MVTEFKKKNSEKRIEGTLLSIPNEELLHTPVFF